MGQEQQVSGLVLLKSAVESEKFQGRLQQCVAENKGAFASSILDLYSGDQQLQTCEPNAILTECLKAAALNLPINKALGFAYVVVYNNNVKRTDPKTGAVSWVKVPTPTFILGYKGYIQLAMRTGQYRTMNADVVYEGEILKVDKLSGTIYFDNTKKSDKIVGYFAYFELVNGFQKVLYMSLDDMAAYALRYSPSLPKNTTKEELKAKANSGEVSKKVGWFGNFNDMALKGLSLDTLIPTPTGFTTMGEIKVGDKVYNALGEETTVIAKSEVKHLPCYEIEFQNGDTFICDEEHRWLVKGKDQKPSEWSVMEAKDMYAVRQLGYSINIPNNPSVEFPEKDLPADPYCLGYWLGNGTARASSVTCLDTDADEVSAQFERLFSVSRRYDDRNHSCCLNISAKEGEKGAFVTQLREAGVYGNKHIPDIYKRASKAQRIALIQGLCDSDGTICKQRRRVTYISVRQELVEDMYEILSSLGEKCYTSSYIARGFGCETRVWAIGWLPTHFNPFRLPRKANRVKDRDMVESTAIKAIRKIDSVPTQCIAVDSGDAANEEDLRKTFLIGTGFKVTHNTCVRRLISKWGYMSIQMQQAYADEVKAESDAMANRQEAIESTGVVDVTMQVEELPAKDAEQTSPQPAAAEVDEVDEGPGY